MGSLRIGMDVVLQDDVGVLRLIEGENAFVMSASTGELVQIPVDEVREAVPRSADRDPTAHATSLWLLGRSPQQIFSELSDVYEDGVVREAMDSLSEFVFEATEDRPYYVGESVRTRVEGRRILGQVVAYAPEDSVWVEWSLPDGKTSVGRVATSQLDRSFTLLLRARDRILHAARLIRDAQGMGSGTPDDPMISPMISPTRRMPGIGPSLDEFPNIEQIPEADPELTQLAQKMMQAQERLLQAQKDKATANKMLAETEEALLVKSERANEAGAQAEVNDLAKKYSEAAQKVANLTEVTEGMDFRRFEMALNAAEGNVRQVVAMVNKRVKTVEDPARADVTREILAKVKEAVGPVLQGLDEALFYFESAMEELEQKLIAETSRPIYETVVAEFPYTENMEETTRPRTRAPKAPKAPAEGTPPGVPASGQDAGGIWSKVRSLVTGFIQGVQAFAQNLMASQQAVREVTPQLEQLNRLLQQALSGASA